MKILYINALTPKEKAPQRGIFVSQRVKVLQHFGIDIIPMAYDVEYSKSVKAILNKLTGFPDYGQAIDTQLGVTYKTRKVVYNFAEVLTAKINPMIFQYKVALQLEKDIRDNANLDLIHLHWIWPSGIGVAAMAIKKHIPYIVTCHGSEINVCMKEARIRKMILYVLENAASVEFISKALLLKAKEWGYTGKNGRIVYNGIDTNTFYMKPLVNRTSKCVGFVGNLIPIKGADRLCKIFAEVFKEYKGEVKFIIVGTGGLMEDLEKQMLGLPCTFMGYLAPEELAQVYAQMDILVVPSREEGYACVVKEAQACGVIPIGSDVGGIKEAVGKYGELVMSTKEEEIIKEFVVKILKYLNEEKSFNKFEMAEKAVECAWTNRQKESLNIYKEILHIK